MKVTPHKILKLVYILIGIFLVLTKVERIVTTDEEGYESITIKYPYDTYSDKALYELLSSSEWQSVSESTLEESPIKE